jgi:UDP-galactopyranose mutase
LKKAVIVGGGIAGCAAAHQISLLGDWEITLIEQAPFLGAGVRTFYHGGHPYTYGPRHFLTQNEKVFEYLNTIVPLRRCNHEFWTYVEQDKQFYNFPIHVDDIERMPDKDRINAEINLSSWGGPLIAKSLEEYWCYSVGGTLYNKFINKYSRKMWGVEATEIDTFSWSPKGVALKSGPRAAWDTAISAYPIALDGYNKYFDFATQGVNVQLSTKITHYDLDGTTIPSVRAKGIRYYYDVLVLTTSPDVPFNFSYGELPYIGRDFHKIVLPVEFALPKDVYWVYEAGSEAWTRTTEYKKFTQYKSDQTLLGMEIPSSNGKHYPIPIKKYQVLANMYHKLMRPGVFCLGRSGCYRYGLDIGGCIEQAMGLAEILKQGGDNTHPVVGDKWRKI